MRDVWQVFSGNAERIRPVVVPSGNDDFLAMIFVPQIRRAVDDKRALMATDPVDAFVEARFDPVMFNGAAVVFEASARVGFPPAIVIGRSPISMRSGVVKKSC